MKVRIEEGETQNASCLQGSRWTAKDRVGVGRPRTTGNPNTLKSDLIVTEADLIGEFVCSCVTCIDHLVHTATAANIIDTLTNNILPALSCNNLHWTRIGSTSVIVAVGLQSSQLPETVVEPVDDRSVAVRRLIESLRNCMRLA